MTTPRVLAFAGSLRAGSYNRKLLRIAASCAREAGGDVTELDLRDYPLPVFDEDLEARDGMPDSGQRLKDMFLGHGGLILSCPEYNSSITAALKNALDWVSRQAPGEPAFAPFAGKVVGLLSASPGALGGLRGLVHVRAILGNLQMVVLPQQVAVVRAHEAFTEEGGLRDAKVGELVRSLATAVVRSTERLAG